MNEIQGLVLYSIDYKEKSKIVYLYTPYGLDSVKANHSKDVSKGLLGFTTTFNEVSYLKTNQKFPTLLEYSLIHSNFELTNSIATMKVVSNILEILRNIPQDSQHEKIYEFVIHTVHDLKNNPPQKVLCVFLIKMLYVFGVTPNLKTCMKCGAPHVQFFSIQEGGSFCSYCSHKMNEEQYQIWKEYYYDKKPLNEFTDVDFVSLLKDIVLYYQIHVHIQLK